MEGKINKALEWMNLIVTEPFYMLYFLAFFSYSVVHTSVAPLLLPHITYRLIYRELQAALAFSVLTAIKIVREETWEGFTGDTLFFAKIFLVGLTLVMDYHLAIWYIAIFFVIYLLAQQPVFQELGTCSKLTPLQLESLLMEGNKSRFWLHYLYACIYASFWSSMNVLNYSSTNMKYVTTTTGLQTFLILIIFTFSRKPFTDQKPVHPKVPNYIHLISYCYEITL
ncbi:hypothetical protein UlMin_025621 [Ulmus minor]